MKLNFNKKQTYKKKIEQTGDAELQPEEYELFLQKKYRNF